MDIDRLNNGEKLASVSAAVLFVALFSPWFGWAGYEGGFTAWQAFTWIDLLLFLTVVGGLGLAILAGTAREVALPVSGGHLVAAVGGIALLLVLYRLVAPPGFAGELGVTAVYPDGFPSVRLEYGAWLGFVSVGGVAIGGMLSLNDSAEADARVTRAVPGRPQG